MSDKRNPLPELFLQLNKCECSSRSLGLELLDERIVFEINSTTSIDFETWKNHTLDVSSNMLMLESPRKHVYSVTFVLLDSFRDTLVNLLEKLEADSSIDRYYIIL
jgi:hypothetical protein